MEKVEDELSKKQNILKDCKNELSKKEDHIRELTIQNAELIKAKDHDLNQLKEN